MEQQRQIYIKEQLYTETCIVVGTISAAQKTENFFKFIYNLL